MGPRDERADHLRLSLASRGDAELLHEPSARPRARCRNSGGARATEPAAHRARGSASRTPGRRTRGAGPTGAGADGHWDSALYRVVVPRQNLVVRLNGIDGESRPEDYLPAVRPYGILGMAWAIWREVPDVPPKEALSLSWRIREDGEAVVLKTSKLLAGYVRGRLRDRHHLVARLERID